MSEKILTARLLKTRGLRGEVKIEMMDDRTGRFRAGLSVFTDQGDRLTVETFRQQGKFGFLRFQEIRSIEEAQPFVGKNLYCLEEDLPALPEDVYYVKDLMGLTVVDEAGKLLGVIAEVMETGANDVYLIRKEDGHSFMLPAVKEFIRSVDLIQHRMVVHLIDGIEESL